MSKVSRVALGLDFGTESVRALIVDLAGRELGSASNNYRHGQILDRLPASDVKLPTDFALQHPSDWFDSAVAATEAALAEAACDARHVIGIGVDFTSCTMLPTLRDGTPLCCLEAFSDRPHAWPKLWKHHGAHSQTDRINRVARQRQEPWLARYGGAIGLEWFFPKMLETLTEAGEVYAATEVWLEAGDWFVWQLVGGDAAQLPRSTCQAGYKAMWSAEEGYPSTEFLAAVHPQFVDVVTTRMPGRLCPPGTRAGSLQPSAAQRLGLPAGIAVSAAIIDAHAAVPGVGATDDGTLVMVLGTSSCHMLNARENCAVPGVAGIVKDGILPGFYGYETGQAAVGDLFDWVRRLTGQTDFTRLSADAEQLPPGAEGVTCIDWMNGCRTPLMNGRLRGQFAGLTLQHGPVHLYRAAIEATAFGVRWIVDLLREHGVPVRRFIATGGLPRHNPLIVQVYADVLQETVEVHPSEQGSARGAAILGAMAAVADGGATNADQVLRQMAGPPEQRGRLVAPQDQASPVYTSLYRQYRREAEWRSQL